MTDLVTGGTGVVGSAVIRHLVDAGREVRALVRSPEAGRRLEESGVATVLGDVLDEVSLTKATEGIDVVYHLAGVNSFCLADPEPMLHVNVDGSRNVVAAARRSGVNRLVYTSSAAALGEEAGTVGHEGSPHRGSYLSDYERSKHLAEQAVFAEAGSLEVVAVNPSSVQGPGRATGTARLILDVIRGRLPALVRTRLSMVDIDDCARGHLLTAERGRAGQRYVLNGFTLSIEEALDLLGRELGRDLSIRFVPGWVATAAATGIELTARLSRKHPKVCREMVRTMLHGHAYDGSKAGRELGLEYLTAEATLRRLVAWFRNEGLIEH